MRNYLKHSFSFFICLSAALFEGCYPKVISDPVAYATYLNDKNNGFTREKSTSGIRYTLKYLPSSYLAYHELKEIQGLTKRQKDSVVTTYEHSLTFLLTVGPAEKETFDITQKGVSNYADFAERIEKMAFEAQDWMSLKEGTNELKPALVRLETLNTPGPSRNFIVVFDTSLGSTNTISNDLCFVYNDELFNTGTSKFIFRAKDLQKLPQFLF